MTPKTFGGLAAFLLLGTALGGCVPPDIGSDMVAPPPPPPPAYDAGKVGEAIETAVDKTPKTTIYTNVFNGSGGSCVDASVTRGQAIASTLTTMQNTGQIPADHTIEVHTYSGYRVPGIDYGSLHTYTVTQIKGRTGR